MIIQQIINLVAHPYLIYLIIFLASLLEASPIGTIITGQTLVMIAGFVAHENVISLGDLVLFAALGAILGDLFSFWLGKKYGLSFLKKYGKYFFFKEEYIKKTEPFIKNNLVKVVILGRLNSLTRSFAPFLLGIHKADFKRFLAANVIGGFMWATLYALIGYIFGEGYKIVGKYIGVTFTTGIIVAVLLYYLYRFVAIKKKLLSKEDLTLVLVALASIVFFSSILEDLHDKEFWFKADVFVNSFIPIIQKTLFVDFSKILSYLFDTTSLLIISLILVLFLWFKDSKKDSLFFGSVMMLDAIIISVIKVIVHRHRPLNALVNETGFSFPSGHGMTAIVFFGIMIYFALKRIKSENIRLTTILISSIMILLIGFSRIYLNVHWLSDVLGGYALGLFLLMISILILKALEKSHSKTKVIN